MIYNLFPNVFFPVVDNFIHLPIFQTVINNKT